jgi:hypothetical protein
VFALSPTWPHGLNVLISKAERELQLTGVGSSRLIHLKALR